MAEPDRSILPGPSFHRGTRSEAGAAAPEVAEAVDTAGQLEFANHPRRSASVAAAVSSHKPQVQP